MQANIQVHINGKMYEMSEKLAKTCLEMAAEKMAEDNLPAIIGIEFSTNKGKFLDLQKEVFESNKQLLDAVRKIKNAAKQNKLNKHKVHYTFKVEKTKSN